MENSFPSEFVRRRSVFKTIATNKVFAINRRLVKYWFSEDKLLDQKAAAAHGGDRSDGDGMQRHQFHAKCISTQLFSAGCCAGITANGLS